MIKSKRVDSLKLCRGSFSGDGEIAGIVPKKIQAEGISSAGRGGLCFALDGSISIFIPLWQEELSPPLRALRRLLESKVPQCCGLNPKSNRQDANIQNARTTDIFLCRCANSNIIMLDLMSLSEESKDMYVVYV